MSIKKNKNTTRDAGREYSWYQKRFAPNCGSENIVSGVNSSACGFQNTILGDDGNVIVIASSTNAVNTDTNAKFCVFKSGTNIQIKNRLGATKIIKYELKY